MGNSRHSLSETENGRQYSNELSRYNVGAYLTLPRTLEDAACKRLVESGQGSLKEPVLHISLVLLSEFAIFLNHVTAYRAGE